MKVKVRIYDSINRMDAHELGMLYGQIKLMEMMKSGLPKKKKAALIEKIHEMTASSDGRWSDAVTEDREDRL